MGIYVHQFGEPLHTINYIFTLKLIDESLLYVEANSFGRGTGECVWRAGE